MFIILISSGSCCSQTSITWCREWRCRWSCNADYPRKSGYVVFYHIIFHGMHLWPQVKLQAFFVPFMLKWTEQIQSGCSVHPKKQNKSKNTPWCYQSPPDDSQQLHHSCTHRPWSPKCLHSRTNQWSRNADILGWFCVSRHLLFVTCFLSLIQFDSRGKSWAPVIQDDTDWNMMQVQLHEQVRHMKGWLNTITVSFNLDTMEGFKNHRQVSVWCSHLHI